MLDLNVVVVIVLIVAAFMMGGIFFGRRHASGQAIWWEYIDRGEVYLVEEVDRKHNQNLFYITVWKKDGDEPKLVCVPKVHVQGVQRGDSMQICEIFGKTVILVERSVSSDDIRQWRR